MLEPGKRLYLAWDTNKDSVGGERERDRGERERHGGQPNIPVLIWRLDMDQFCPHQFPLVQTFFSL